MIGWLLRVRFGSVRTLRSSSCSLRSNARWPSLGNLPHAHAAAPSLPCTLPPLPCPSPQPSRLLTQPPPFMPVAAPAFPCTRMPLYNNFPHCLPATFGGPSCQRAFPAFPFMWFNSPLYYFTPYSPPSQSVPSVWPSPVAASLPTTTATCGGGVYYLTPLFIHTPS